MPERLRRDSQQGQVFDYCVKNRRNTDALYVSCHLSAGWSLLQYKAPEFVVPDTPVWAIWNNESDDEKHCFVVYGDPHLVYFHDEQEVGVEFVTTAKFELGNGDVVYFSGAEAANGQLSTVYIQRKDVHDGSTLVWGRAPHEPPTPEIVGTITEDGLTLES